MWSSASEEENGATKLAEIHFFEYTSSMRYLHVLSLLSCALLSSVTNAASFEVKLFENGQPESVLDSRLNVKSPPPEAQGSQNHSVEDEDFVRAAQVSTRVMVIDPVSWAPVEKRFTLKIEQGSAPSEYVVTPRVWIDNTELQRESEEVWWPSMNLSVGQTILYEFTHPQTNASWQLNIERKD